ncbi:MAG: hypothetical protein IJX96_03815 [Clostridia bacterium]|nr:hypothetical protein [Clostridia bacterium]
MERKKVNESKCIEYTCLKNIRKSFILTRKPESVEKELIFSFWGAPSGATAIFENAKGDSLYRLLFDETCVIPVEFLIGEIKVTLAVFHGKADAEKYNCEPICTECVNGGLLVYPNWLDLPMQIIEIYGAIQAVKDDIDKLSGKYEELGGKVERLLDGYDFD